MLGLCYAYDTKDTPLLLIILKSSAVFIEMRQVFCNFATTIIQNKYCL